MPQRHQEPQLTPLQLLTALHTIVEDMPESGWQRLPAYLRDALADADRAWQQLETEHKRGGPPLPAPAARPGLTVLDGGKGNA